MPYMMKDLLDHEVAIFNGCEGILYPADGLSSPPQWIDSSFVSAQWKRQKERCEHCGRVDWCSYDGAQQVRYCGACWWAMLEDGEFWEGPCEGCGIGDPDIYGFYWPADRERYRFLCAECQADRCGPTEEDQAFHDNLWRDLPHTWREELEALSDI
jgi:hypothetical protein